MNRRRGEASEGRGSSRLVHASRVPSLSRSKLVQEYVCSAGFGFIRFDSVLSLWPLVGIRFPHHNGDSEGARE